MSNIGMRTGNIDVDVVCAAIGNRKHDYYCNKWGLYLRAGIPWFDWNWAAFFFGWFWFAYRKLWLVCLAYYICLFPLLELVGRIGGGRWFIGVGLVIKFVLIPAVSNQLYFYYVLRKAKSVSADMRREEISTVLHDRFQTVFDVSASNPKVF